MTLSSITKKKKIPSQTNTDKIPYTPRLANYWPSDNQKAPQQ